MANMLFAITKSKSLDLILLRDIIIWEARGLKSTTDHIFMSEKLLRILIGCEVRKDLHHGSNHYPIATYLDLTLDTEPVTRKKA